MRVLFISLSLPPFAESQTIRSAYLIRALAQHGVAFDLITAHTVPSMTDPSLESLLPESCRIWRTEVPTYDRIVERLKRAGRRRLLYLYSNLAYRLFAPDVRRGWNQQAVALVQQVTERFPPDLLMSASGSATAHLAAAQLKRTLQRAWVADLGDPWSWVDWQHPDTWLKAIQNRWLERRTLPQADLLIWTTEATQRAYQQWYHRTIPPSIVIPYGYRQVDFPVAPQPATVPIRFAYVGAASRRARNLIPFLEALAHTRNAMSLTLQIVGDASHHFQRAAHALNLPQVHFTGRVSYADSLHYIREAGVLVLVGNKSPYQVPGKTFLYLASGRPILYLSQMPHADDPTYQLLSAFEGVAVVPNQAQAIREWLEYLNEARFRAWEAEARMRHAAPSLEPYEVHSLGRQLYDSLKHIVERTGCSD